MNDDFSARMQAFIAASGGRLSVYSGYRSVETQQQLWEEAVATYGAENANMWVAPPGKSNHNRGMAADIGYETEDAMAWAHANAAKFGLEFPMEWEPWHIEPAGLRDGTFGEVDFESYTVPPTGYLSATDPNRRADPGFALGVINSMLLQPKRNSLLGPVANSMAGTVRNSMAGKNPTPGMIETAASTGAKPTFDMLEGETGGLT
jgi:hypothetical protein